MTKIRDALSVYFLLVLGSVRAQMQYRASFFAQAFSMFVLTGGEFCAVILLFQRFHAIAGFVLSEVAVLYGLVNVAMAIADAVARGFDRMDQLVRSGEFDRILVRPRSAALQVFGLELTLRRLGRLAQGALALVWGLSQAPHALSLDGYLVFAFALLGSIATFIGVFVIQGTVTFWTVRSLEVMNIMIYGGSEVACYPMGIYSRFMRGVFTAIIPLGCVIYFPVLRILNHADPLGTPAWLGGISPIAGFAFLAASLAFFRFGIRRYTSTGS